MTEVVQVPPELSLLFDQVSQKFDETETEDVIHKVRRRYPSKQDSFDQTDLNGTLKQLYLLGAIDDDGNQRLLEILAERASKKEEILKLISGYKEASSTPKHAFVGRDADVINILKRVTNRRVPGINLFGDSGVGKTTLAKEVSKRMVSSFHKVFIDVREITCLDNVYFNILQALDLPSWGDNKKERIYKHLEDFNTKTVLILDSVEQLLSTENKEEPETRADFLEFLEVTISSEASKKGYLKVILTSTRQLNEAALKRNFFAEYNVQPFSNDVSKDFISKRNRRASRDVQQDEAMSKITELCHNNAYILQGAQHLMREGFSTPTDVLRKITAQIAKGLPKEFACISAVFESLPSDHLRQVAVKISLLRRPFSVSTAMKITEIFSDYDAELDLEMLAIHRIITAEDVNGKRKYDLHALFRSFVTSHLCRLEDPVYKEQLKRGEKLFFEHFSGKLTKLAKNLENEFVKTYSQLEGNRANFELAVHLSEENKETFDLLLHTDDHNQFALMGILFEVLKDVTERRKLFGKWAEMAEVQEQWSTSALMRCWQSIQGCDLEGALNEEILGKAKTSIQKLRSSNPDHEKLDEVHSLFLHCQGKVKWMKAYKLVNSEQGTSNQGKKLLKEGIQNLKESVELKGDKNTLTARALNLIGNCYMDLEDPMKAKEYYQQALDMKIKLVGNEKHWEIPTYYNQLAQVHERLGREEEEKWYNRLFGLKESAREEYGKALEWTEKALALQKELGVNDTDYTAIFQRNLAIILIGLEEYDKALECAQKSFEIRNKRLGKHPETVRILYLIGVIHEDRKDLEAALQIYEEAFVMEESLPDDNHSIVRKMLCDRLDEMCKKLEHSFLRNDLFLYFPPKSVPKRTTVKYNVLPNDYSPSPTDTEETLVSNIFELGPNDLVIRRSIIVGLMHSGPGRDLGYETVVKAFNKRKGQWEEIKELQDKSHLPEDCKRDFIQAQISKPTILAVVTRLITDRFHVTPKGCVVKSSVCHDVTVEFPEGAVDKTVEGTMKMLLVDSSLRKQEEGYPSPILCVEGFLGVQFQKLPVANLPQPALSPEKHFESKICVLCLEDNKHLGGAESHWKDVTKEIHIEESEHFIQLHVTHFSWLCVWKWINIPPITYISSFFEYIWSPPRNVCFAAFKINEDPLDNSIQLGLLCVENRHIYKIKELKGFSELRHKTGKEKMRIDDEAYVEIEEDFRNMRAEPVILRFIGGEETYQDELYICKREESNKSGGNEMLQVSFYTEKNQERRVQCVLLYKDPAGTRRLCHDKIRRPKIEVPEKGQEDAFVRPTNFDEIPCCDQPHQTDNVYKMTSDPRGVAMIVNIEKYHIDDPHHPMYGKLEDRVGSKKDEDDVTHLFQNLNFIVETINKTSANELLAELTRISTEYHFEDFDCFVLFIMSHGAKDCIYASDGGQLTPSLIVSLFRKCKSLAGKPKLFFFQGCRGRKEDRGVTMADAPGDPVKMSTTQATSDADEIAETADILEFYSSYIGYVSYRNSVTGSPFIQSIVEVFRKNACRHHILELVTKVMKKVSEKSHEESHEERKKQMPHHNATLTKHLYFWPGVTF